MPSPPESLPVAERASAFRKHFSEAKIAGHRPRVRCDSMLLIRSRFTFRADRSMHTRGRRCLAADEKKKKVAHRRGASQRQRQAFGKTRRTGSSAMLRLLRPRPEAQWLVRRARREALLGSGPLRPPGAGPLEGALDDVLVPSRGSSPGKGEHFSTEML